jgi:hypothetical protein
MDNPATKNEHVVTETDQQDGIVRRTQPDRNSAGAENKPSRLAWMGLAILCAASIAMISASLAVRKIVIQIDSIAGFTQIKGSVIAIVGTIVHILILNLVIKSTVLTLLWRVNLSKNIRFSLLYNAITGMGPSRLNHSAKNGNYVDILLWSLLPLSSIAAAIITGSIFKDTTCVTPVSITTPAASYWRQVAGGGSFNNSVITASQAASMAMGSIANRMDSPGVIYNRTSTIALRPLQHPEVFQNITTVFGLEAISTSVTCNLSLSADVVNTYHETVSDPANEGMVRETLEIKSGDYIFNVSVEANGPQRFTWINITDLSVNDTYHSITRTLSIINDDAYQNTPLDGLNPNDTGLNLTITDASSTFYITVHLIISSCDVIAHPVLVNMTGDLLRLLDISPSSGSDNWWLIADASGVLSGLTTATESMRARSEAGLTDPGLLQDISTGYAFSKSPCYGIQDCIQQLHSRAFASVLQNAAVPLVYDPQSYQGTINTTCPISTDVSIAILTAGVICACRSISLGIEYVTRFSKDTRAPTVSILELYSRNFRLLTAAMRRLPGKADEGEILDAVENVKVRA